MHFGLWFFLKKVSVWFWVPRSSQQIFEITCCQNSSRSIQVRRYQAGESELLVLKRVNRKNSKRPKWTATSMLEQVSQRKDKFYNNHWNMKIYLIWFFCKPVTFSARNIVILIGKAERLAKSFFVVPLNKCVHAQIFICIVVWVNVNRR